MQPPMNGGFFIPLLLQYEEEIRYNVLYKNTVVHYE